MKPTTSPRRALWLSLLSSLGLLFAVLLAACSSAAIRSITPTPTRTPRYTPTPTLTPTPTPTLTPTPAWPVTIFIPEGLPVSIANALDATLTDHPDLFVPASSPTVADVQVTFDTNPDATILAEWTYAVVAPFPTLTDEVSWTQVISHWVGSPAGPFAGQPLLMTTDTATTLAAAMGEPATDTVEIVPAEEIVPRAWDAHSAWAIVPFDELDPRWKVLYVDGVSALDQRLDVEPYPLVLRIGATGMERGIAKLQEQLPRLTNRDPAKMSVVVMTGVTALTRATAMRMNSHGVTYPAEDIRPWLVEADITHISSEVSFAENCPPPVGYTTMVFCSDPTYFELLEDVDVDVIELTGNHLLDWGLDAMKLSLLMYDTHELPYYGGGWDLAQAQRPLTLTHGVHTFGFAGCNPAGPRSNWATKDLPGSAPCDYELLYTQISQMREQSIIPIVTLQYWEFYQYEPTPQQRVDFRALAEAGAVIVSGSQAHQPQGFDFHAGAFIHYGLGNLFFDQMQSLETRQEFVDRHVFYDGRHISTEILTAILEDYARPRPMTDDEREALLKATFAASGW
ncbi:MAG: CapA family protein [Chloroflexota bacterium]|nr:CapA family protein [Chloroflexota bacterium]